MEPVTRKRAREATDEGEPSTRKYSQDAPTVGGRDSQSGTGMPRQKNNHQDLDKKRHIFVRISPLTENFNNTRFLVDQGLGMPELFTQELTHGPRVSVKCESAFGEKHNLPRLPLKLLRRFSPAIDKGIKGRGISEDSIKGIILDPIGEADGIKHFLVQLAEQSEDQEFLDELAMINDWALERVEYSPLYNLMLAFTGSVALGLPLTVILKDRIKQILDERYSLEPDELAKIYKLRYRSSVPIVEQVDHLNYMLALQVFDSSMENLAENIQCLMRYPPMLSDVTAWVRKLETKQVSANALYHDLFRKELILSEVALYGDISLGSEEKDKST